MNLSEKITVAFFLQAIFEQEVSMKDASDLLGISYNIIYGKYREIFGPLSKKNTSKQKRKHSPIKSTQIPSNDLDSLNIIEYNEYTGTRQEFWEEHYVRVLLRVSHDITVFVLH